jgi:hypothetical protein
VAVLLRPVVAAPPAAGLPLALAQV